ncbi:MAG: type II/IV secretion system ATPase subunit [Thaumarchaeota archaeon]|nr:type II/IV secretion system ATPase subunit [Nitrososphaerota archaeon]
MIGFKKNQDKTRKDSKSQTIRYPPVGFGVPQSWKEVERYALNAPFAYAVIAEDPSTATKKYFLDEVNLTQREGQVYTYILDTLESELTVPRGEVDPKTYFREQARRIAVKYGIKASQLAWPKILYFAERDLVGFGVLDGLMRDPNIEDISADGLRKPLFVYQRKYENMETNIAFNEDKDLDNLVARLSHMAGKHISTAFPIVQGTLPGRHRLSATYRREVSPYGGTFTVRKFREDPITITDLINMNVIDSNIAAYVWLLMENRSTAMVVGATGSGKTTLMNALLTFTRMNSKIVTIEEVQEANLPHNNWTALLSRESYGVVEDSGREIGLFDLVKTAMRMRPDILVVGEVRGEETYVLFQAISTGHGGISTVHADDVGSAIQRLTSKPMDVPAAFIPFLDLVFTVRRIAIPTPDGGFRNVRRVLSVDEVVSVGNYVKMFKWDPVTDRHVPSPLKNSVKLARLSRDLGLTVAELADEIARRATVLKWVQQKGIRNFKEVSTIYEEYRTDPRALSDRAYKELGLIRVATESGA